MPTSDKAGSAPDAAASTGASADGAAKQEAQKPAEGVTSYGVLAAVLGTVAIAGVAFVALRKRRDTTKNFGPATSTKPSGLRVEPQPAAKVQSSAARGAAPAAAAAAASTSASSEERSSRAGGSTATSSPPTSCSMPSTSRLARAAALRHGVGHGRVVEVGWVLR